MVSNIRSKTVSLKTARGRKISSARWLMRQLNDQFVVQSKIDGYRSRAAYKLIEINEKFKIFKKGMNILDLGAAPGGWSQVVSNIIGNTSDPKILAIDLLPIDSIAGVKTMIKDFYEQDAAEIITQELGGKVDVVMSDMAANTTGHNATDHLRIMVLCEKAATLSYDILKPGGCFISKIFKGGTEDEVLSEIKKKFTKIKHFKPKSSRKESSEEYLVATGFRG
jgi:23S rRNA (uridine2552-2'-O)-methyltransferase